MAFNNCCNSKVDYDLSTVHPKSSFAAMNELRQQQLFCDITINIGSLAIHAHRLILVATIPYFRAMFAHDVRERGQNEVTLHDIDARSLASIIDFCYTSRVSIDQTNVQTLLRVAAFLQIEAVQQCCCEYLESQLEPGNVIGIRSFAEGLGCRDLESISRSYCDRHFTQVVKHEEFFMLSLEQVTSLLSHNELCVRAEIEVLKAALAWVEHDSANRSECLTEILRMIRFHQIPKVSLDSLSKTNALQEKEKCFSIIQKSIEGSEWRGDQDGGVRTPHGDEVIYCVGGYQKQSLTLFEVYHQQSENWLALAPMSKPKSGCGSAYLGGYLYLVGGRTNSAYGNLDSDTVERFDPFTSEWSEMAKLTVPRNRLGVGVIDGHIYAVGGNDGMVHLNTVERFDAEENMWMFVPPMAKRRIGVGVAVLERIMYAVGGFDSENRLESVEAYSPDTNSWKEVAPMNTPRSGAGVTALNGCIYAVGGYNGVAQLNSAERYCPKDDRWTLISPMEHHRSALSVAVVKNKLFAIGGYDGEMFLSSVEVYDPETGEWRAVASLSVGRSGACVAVGILPLT